MYEEDRLTGTAGRLLSMGTHGIMYVEDRLAGIIQDTVNTMVLITI